MKRAQLLAAVCWFAFASTLPGIVPACAQTSVAQGQVTIFTDGLAHPNGRISRALMELSLAFDEGNKLRLLPIMAHGGEGNVRDLLRFRGVDMAVMNNDVFAAPGVDKNYPEARRKLRLVTRLYTQKVFLLAQPDITDVQQLAGKKILIVGPESAARLTAATIFSLLKIKAEFVPAPSTGRIEQLPDVQAIFFLEEDARRLSPEVVRSAGFVPLGIPAQGPLAAVYRPAIILAQEAAPYSGQEDGVNTVSVDTILAAFDWQPTHGRYADVTAFIDGLFAAISKLRREQPGSIWGQTDPRADVLGWKRFSYADTVKKSVPPAPKEEVVAAASTAPDLIPGPAGLPAMATTPAALPAEAAPAVKLAARGEAAPADATLRLSIVAEPPLTDQRSPGGGLIAELTAAALQRSGTPYRTTALQWEKDKVGQLKTVLSDQKADLGLPWEEPGCEDMKHLRMETAALCDGGLISDPLFKVLVLFFMNASSDFTFANDESLAGRTVCLPADRDLTSLSEAGRALVDAGKLTLVRPASLDRLPQSGPAGRGRCRSRKRARGQADNRSARPHRGLSHGGKTRHHQEHPRGARQRCTRRRSAARGDQQRHCQAEIGGFVLSDHRQVSGADRDRKMIRRRVLGI